jgi:hypothetical protein
MVFEMFFVRRAYAEILAHELKKTVRMLRAVPAERFDVREAGCGASARELAMGVVRHVRRIDEIACGGGARPFRPDVPSRGEIMLELETAFLGAQAALAMLPSARWAEVIPAPIGLPALRQGRRGELLWLALRELIRHDNHFAAHVRGVTRSADGSKAAATAAEASVGGLAIGA